jgi:hypothetical protein
MTEQTQDTEQKSFADKAKDAGTAAKDAVTSAATSTVQAAKDNPVTAAGIAVGVAAAVAGAVVGASKLREGGDTAGDQDPKKA